MILITQNARGAHRSSRARGALRLPTSCVFTNTLPVALQFRRATAMQIEAAEDEPPPKRSPTRLISQSGGVAYQPMSGKKPALMLSHSDGDDGMSADDYLYLEESVVSAVRARVGWLALFLVGLWGAAFVVNHFEHLLQHNVELAHFVPLIIGHGGNAGSQAVSSVIRALATKEILATKDTPQVVFKESTVGILVGLVLGIVVVVVSRITQLVSFDIAMVVAISLPLVSVFANGIGALLPLVAARFGSNPALTSAPLMTTIIDSSGLVIYFIVAHYYLSWAQFHPDLHHDVSHTHAALGESSHRPHDARGGASAHL